MMKPCLTCTKKKYGCYCDKYMAYCLDDTIEPILTDKEKKMDKFNKRQNLYPRRKRK